MYRKIDRMDRMVHPFCLERRAQCNPRGRSNPQGMTIPFTMTFKFQEGPLQSLSVQQDCTDGYRLKSVQVVYNGEAGAKVIAKNNSTRTSQTYQNVGQRRRGA
jgi:hypothetical protein